MKIATLACVLALIGGAAHAQMSGAATANPPTYSPGTNPLSLDLSGNLRTATTPSATTPVAGSQYGLALVSATTLTVPATARVAQVTIEGQSIRCTTDGTTTPTATVGALYQAGSVLNVWTPALTNFKCIQTAASATLDVEYSK